MLQRKNATYPILSKATAGGSRFGPFFVVARGSLAGATPLFLFYACYDRRYTMFCPFLSTE